MYLKPYQIIRWVQSVPEMLLPMASHSGIPQCRHPCASPAPSSIQGSAQKPPPQKGLPDLLSKGSLYPSPDPCLTPFSPLAFSLVISMYFLFICYLPPTHRLEYELREGNGYNCLFYLSQHLQNGVWHPEAHAKYWSLNECMPLLAASLTCLVGEVRLQYYSSGDLPQCPQLTAWLVHSARGLALPGSVEGGSGLAGDRPGGGAGSRVPGLALSDHPCPPAFVRRRQLSCQPSPSPLPLGSPASPSP